MIVSSTIACRAHLGFQLIAPDFDLVKVHAVHYNRSHEMRTKAAVPTIHRFDNFRIDMRSRDHNPPHFHMIGPDFHALVDIQTLQVIRGTFDRKALVQAIEWASGQTENMMNEWRRLNERD